MTENTATRDYADSGLDALESGRRRLQLLESMCDDHTFSTLGTLEISPEWRCLEIGAGAGSVARWLAQRVPRGKVVATDLSIAHLPSDIANLHPFEHDVRTDEFAPGSFDLIHVRAVLQHLRNAPELVLRVLQWLRPGGWIVVDEIDFGPGAASPLPQLRRIGALCLDTARQVIGTDNEFCRRVPMLLKDAGLMGVGATYRGHAVGEGSVTQALLSQSMTQLRPVMLNGGFCSEQELGDLISWLDTNDVVDVALMTISTWGRKVAEPHED